MSAKRISRLLDEFWSRSSDVMDANDRLRLIREFDHYVIKRPGPRRLAKMRDSFNYGRRDFAKLLEHPDLAPVCFVCWRPACHRHHIIELKNGGGNHSRNIVPLCKPCHGDVHPWMSEQRGTLPHLQKVYNRELSPEKAARRLRRRMGCVSLEASPRLVKGVRA